MLIPRFTVGGGEQQRQVRIVPVAQILAAELIAVAAGQHGQPGGQHILLFFVESGVEFGEGFAGLGRGSFELSLVGVVKDHGERELAELRAFAFDAGQEFAQLRLHRGGRLVLLHVFRTFLLRVAAERGEDGREDVHHILRAVKVADLLRDQLPGIEVVHGLPLGGDDGFGGQLAKSPEHVRLGVCRKVFEGQDTNEVIAHAEESAVAFDGGVRGEVVDVFVVLEPRAVRNPRIVVEQPAKQLVRFALVRQPDAQHVPQLQRERLGLMAEPRRRLLDRLRDSDREIPARQPVEQCSMRVGVVQDDDVVLEFEESLRFEIQRPVARHIATALMRDLADAPFEQVLIDPERRAEQTHGSVEPLGDAVEVNGVHAFRVGPGEPEGDAGCAGFGDEHAVVDEGARLDFGVCGARFVISGFHWIPYHSRFTGS